MAPRSSGAAPKLKMRFPWQNLPPSHGEVADEFVEFLRQEWSHLKIGTHDADAVEIAMPDGADGTLFLHKLHVLIRGMRRNNPRMRKVIYGAFAQQMLSAENQIPLLESLDAATVAKKIFPRVTRSDVFAALGDNLEEAAPPSRTLADTDFKIVYVLDFDDRVAYVMGAQAEVLKMDEEQLYQQSLANARLLFSHAECRSQLGEFGPKKVANLIECKDGHAGARLLVLSEYLDDGEEVAAVILENSAFLLALVPPDNNFNPLRAIAKKGGSPHVQQPFLVTRDGIKAM